MRRLRHSVCALVVLLLAAGPASAADFGLGARASTLGAGVEMSVALSERLTLRVPFNTLSFDGSLTENEISYAADVRLRTVGLMADFHVLGGGWRVTAGFYSNGNRLELLASEETGNSEFAVGNRRYRSDPDDPLQVIGSTDFSSVAPYIGTGWGNAARGDSGLYFGFDLGVLFQGAVGVVVDARGAVEDVDSGERFSVEGDSDPAQRFRSELEAERRKLERDLEDFRFYPVVGVAVGWRF